MRIISGIVPILKQGNNCKCLLLRRSPLVPSPNVWSFPMGHAEPTELSALFFKPEEEVFLDIALRELYEETNIDKSCFKNINREFIELVYDDKRVCLFICEIDCDNAFKKTSELELDFENNDFMWFEVDDILNSSFAHEGVYHVLDSSYCTLYGD